MAFKTPTVVLLNLSRPCMGIGLGGWSSLLDTNSINKGKCNDRFSKVHTLIQAFLYMQVVEMYEFEGMNGNSMLAVSHTYRQMVSKPISAARKAGDRPYWPCVRHFWLALSNCISLDGWGTSGPEKIVKVYSSAWPLMALNTRSPFADVGHWDLRTYEKAREI